MPMVVTIVAYWLVGMIDRLVVGVPRRHGASGCGGGHGGDRRRRRGCWRCGSTCACCETNLALLKGPLDGRLRRLRLAAVGEVHAAIRRRARCRTSCHVPSGSRCETKSKRSAWRAPIDTTAPGVDDAARGRLRAVDARADRAQRSLRTRRAPVRPAVGVATVVSSADHQRIDAHAATSKSPSRSKSAAATPRSALRQVSKAIVETLQTAAPARPPQGERRRFRSDRQRHLRRGVFSATGGGVAGRQLASLEARVATSTGTGPVCGGSVTSLAPSLSKSSGTKRRDADRARGSVGVSGTAALVGASRVKRVSRRDCQNPQASSLPITRYEPPVAVHVGRIERASALGAEAGIAHSTKAARALAPDSQPSGASAPTRSVADTVQIGAHEWRSGGTARARRTATRSRSATAVVAPDACTAGGAGCDDEVDVAVAIDVGGGCRAPPCLQPAHAQPVSRRRRARARRPSPVSAPLRLAPRGAISPAARPAVRDGLRIGSRCRQRGKRRGRRVRRDRRATRPSSHVADLAQRDV